MGRLQSKRFREEKKGEAFKVRGSPGKLSGRKEFDRKKPGNISDSGVGEGG